MIARLTPTRLAALAACTALACCVPAPREPAPTPPVASAPQPSPPVALPVPQPVYDNWMDAPRTPGDWSYRSQGTGSAALYAAPGREARFALTCDPQARAITLSRGADASGSTSLRIRTETQDRALAAQPTTGAVVTATLPASDPLLSAMAFSKGRFAVETEGAEPLYLPAWPEVTRVLEDCL